MGNWYRMKQQSEKVFFPIIPDQILQYIFLRYFSRRKGNLAPPSEVCQAPKFDYPRKPPAAKRQSRLRAFLILKLQLPQKYVQPATGTRNVLPQNIGFLFIYEQPIVCISNDFILSSKILSECGALQRYSWQQGLYRRHKHCQKLNKSRIGPSKRIHRTFHILHIQLCTIRLQR